MRFKSDSLQRELLFHRIKNTTHAIRIYWNIRKFMYIDFNRNDLPEENYFPLSVCSRVAVVADKATEMKKVLTIKNK